MDPKKKRKKKWKRSEILKNYLTFNSINLDTPDLSLTLKQTIMLIKS